MSSSSSSSSPVSSTKPNSIINTAFADELVQVPPKTFRVHNKRSSNTTESSRTTPSSTQSARSTSQSLSPSTIRNAVVTSPLISPVMKGLRRLSRSHRSNENDDNDDNDDGEGDTVALAPIMQDSACHVAVALQQQQQQKPRPRSLQDTKVLIPSGRWEPSEEEEFQPQQQQQEQQDQPPPSQQSLPTSSSSSAPSTPMDPNTSSKPSSSSSFNNSNHSGNNRPPSGRTTPDDGRAPTPPPTIPPPPSPSPSTTSEMHANSKHRIAKPSSWSSSTHKPPSMSSTGSGDSALIPPRPRRHRASDETPQSHAASGITNTKAQTKPRRARSAAPQIRSSPLVSTTNTDPLQESSLDTRAPERSKTRPQDLLEPSESSATPLGSERRSRRRTSPAESSAKQSTSKGTTTTGTNTNSNKLDDLSAPQSLDPKTKPDESTNRNDLHEHRTKGQPTERQSRDKHRSSEASSGTTSAAAAVTNATPTSATSSASTTKRVTSTRATPEQREVLQRLRSKSKDKSNPPSTNTEPPTRTVPEQRERTARRARSRSRDQSVPTTTAIAIEGEEKSLRRGKKPLSQSDSLKPAPEETATKSSSNSHRHSTRRHSSQKPTPSETTGTLEEGQQQQQQPHHDSSEMTDDKVEKPDSARRLEIMRKNLDKETLAHVQNLKEEIKQMRNQRRKVKFGAKREVATPVQADAETVLASQQHPQQQQTHPLSPFNTKSPSVSRSRHVTMQASLMAIAQSPFQNSGGTIKSDMSSSKSTLQSSKLMADFNNSIGAIGIEDLDVGYVKIVPPPPSEETIRIQALQKQLRKTRKLIKRTTRDVWTERDEIINLQRKNWSIRKALMQHEGPPDSLTTLNMKIEKLLRQDRELELETDQLNEEKATLEAECAKTAKKIGDFKDLFDKLHKIIVPLLPSPEDAPQEIGTFQATSDLISPLPSPSATNRKAIMVHLSQAPAMDDIEDLSMDSSDENEAEQNQKAENDNDNEEEASLSLSHLRTSASRV